MDADRVEVESWAGVRGLEGPRPAGARARPRQDHRPAHAQGPDEHVLQPDDPRITGPVTLRARSRTAAEGSRRGRRDRPLPRHARRRRWRSRCSRCSATRTTRAPRSRRSSPAPTSSEEFPDDVARLADALPSEVGATIARTASTCATSRSRPSIRRPPATSTTPSRSRRCPNGGTRLWVAVADVSHYVREGTPVDVEARRRGCSVYLPNRAIPMLPEPLSAHICSLVPEQDRLAMVVRIDFDRHAEVVDTDFCAAVIHSQARLDYPGRRRGAGRRHPRQAREVRAVPARRCGRWTRWRGSCARRASRAGRSTSTCPSRWSSWTTTIRAWCATSGARGAIPASAGLRDDRGVHAGRQRGGGGQLPRSAASDALWRIHDAPDRGAAGGLRRAGRALRHPGRRRRGAHAARGCSSVLAAAARDTRRRSRCRSSCCARSSRRRYDVVNIGHFGLASRRLPPLHLADPPLPGPHRPPAAQGAAGGARASRREAGPSSGGDGAGSGRAAEDGRRLVVRRAQAMEIEREVIDLYRAFFMRDRVGDVFDGVISGVTCFGIFVVVDEPFVEGLVRIEELGDDYFNFDDAALPPGRPALGPAPSRSATRSRSRSCRSASSGARSTSRCMTTGRGFARPRGRASGGATAAAAAGREARPAHGKEAGRPEGRGGRDRARAPGGKGGRAGHAGKAGEAGNRRARQAEEEARAMTIRERLEEDEERVLSPFAQKSRASKGRDRPEPLDPIAADLPARSRPHHPLEGVPAAGGEDPGLPRARGRSLPDAHHPHAGGRADRAHGDPRAGPERIADRGDRDGPRPRAHAVRPRRREGAGQADAGRLPPRQAVAAGGRDARAGGAGAEPHRRGARRDPQALEGQGPHHLRQPEPDGDDARGADRPHQRHRRLRQSRPGRRRPGTGGRSGVSAARDPGRARARRTAIGSRAWSTTWCRRRGSKRSGRSG